jgi:hypothetical protein
VDLLRDKTLQEMGLNLLQTGQYNQQCRKLLRRHLH